MSLRNLINGLGVLFLFTVAAGFAEEAKDLTAPEVNAVQPGKQADTSAAAPWFGKLPSLYEVHRSERNKTLLDGREIWYKDRGPSEVKLLAFLMPQKKDASRINVFVPGLTQKTALHGSKQILTFNASLYEKKQNGHRVLAYKADGIQGSPEVQRDQAMLAALTKKPWYELHWGGAAWTKTTNLAKGIAWPLADGLCLNRELTVLLPEIASLGTSLKKGGSFQQTVILPYPAPLSPAFTMPVRYTIKRIYTEEKQRMVSITLAGALKQHRAAGIRWGGISMELVRTSGILSGQIIVNLDHMLLQSAQLLLETQLERVGPGESFSSNWNLNSSWQRVSEQE